LPLALLAQPAKRPLTLDDIANIREVREPQCSPDGKWVAYAVGTTDAKEDKHDSDIWMVSYDGKSELVSTRKISQRRHAEDGSLASLKYRTKTKKLIKN